MNWITKLLSDGDEVSSKRVVAIAGSVVLMALLVANSFVDMNPSAELVYAVLILTSSAFGFSSIEKIKKNG
jgi:hypothetical protein